MASTSHTTEVKEETPVIAKNPAENIIAKIYNEVNHQKCGLSSATSKPIKKLVTTNMEGSKTVSTTEIKNVGKVTAKELQQAFITFQGRHFSDGVCKFVVRLFNLDRNGGLDVDEFHTLYLCIKEWVNAFNANDKGKTGFLNETEFDNALKQMNIHFSSEFLRFLMTKNDPNSKRISFDQFIVTCIQLQKFTDEFKSRDEKFLGTITLKYEDFLEMLMKCV